MTRFQRIHVLAVVSVAIATFAASAASALPGSDIPSDPMTLQRDTAAGQRAVADWDARNPWSYGSDGIFSLTRGLDENGVPGWAKVPVMFFTVPLDLAQLPAAALGGLWGD